MNRPSSRGGYADEDEEEDLAEMEEGSDEGDVDAEVPVRMTKEDLRREEEEIRELERKKRGLEERVVGMERDLGGLMR